jgi:hypothetical protein
LQTGRLESINIGQVWVIGLVALTAFSFRRQDITN